MAAEDDGVMPLQPARLLCNLGDITNLAVARGSNCLFTRVSSFGMEGIAQRVAERSESSLEQAREWLAHVGLVSPSRKSTGIRRWREWLARPSAREPRDSRGR